MRLHTHLIAAVSLLAVLPGCAGGAQSSQQVSSPIPSSSAASAPSPASTSVLPTRVAQAPTATSTAAPSLSEPASARNISTACPVTISNGSTPPGEQPSPNYHGNDALWTALWPGGEVRINARMVDPDGTLDMKFPWWRGPDAVGPLSIEGRRLDAPAPPLQARIPDGYGSTGFQATGILFPSEGCWEITGRAGNARLTFVTLVIKV